MRIFIILILCSFFSCQTNDDEALKDFNTYLQAVYDGNFEKSYYYLSKDEKARWKSLENYKKVQNKVPKTFKMIFKRARFKVLEIESISSVERKIVVEEYLPDFKALSNILIKYMAPYRQDPNIKDLESVLEQKIVDLLEKDELVYQSKKNTYLMVKEKKSWKVIK